MFLSYVFVPNGQGRGLRLCIDDRSINKITIPDRYPLPNMDELRGTVGVHQAGPEEWIPSCPGKERRRMKNGFPVSVRPFRIYGYAVWTVNAQATFQSKINHIFRDLLDQGVFGIYG